MCSAQRFRLPRVHSIRVAAAIFLCVFSRNARATVGDYSAWQKTSIPGVFHKARDV